MVCTTYARSVGERAQEVRKAKVAAAVAEYTFLKTKEAYDAVRGAVPLAEVQRTYRAFMSARAHVEKLESENDN